MRRAKRKKTRYTTVHFNVYGGKVVCHVVFFFFVFFFSPGDKAHEKESGCMRAHYAEKKSGLSWALFVGMDQFLSDPPARLGWEKNKELRKLPPLSPPYYSVESGPSNGVFLILRFHYQILASI